ncbi:LuxR C-terminal-related transcriptional regulator [Natronoflexus pectinivorans]|uniref:Regulatory LuxR family protein n=1 Tax=Natronoflexus pectinivorans TaxID=682526 RepID=A0A4R2GLW5_9BACT|nr:LuxR C-terminal-related transcriptional regulator [Natronoflexus pectinivorans]TCO08481.1 regulatory LuxR family protein [Natronoflexus pectinivorans]
MEDRLQYPEEFYNTIRSIQSRISKPDYSEIRQFIPFAKSIDLLENRPIYLLDLYKLEFLYVSPRYFDILGYSHYNPLNFDFFFDALHPEDGEVNIQGPLSFFEFLSKMDAESYQDYKLVTDFRLRIPTNEYVRIAEQMIVLKTDQLGNPWLTLSISDLSTNEDIKSSSGAVIVSISSGEIVETIGNPDLFKLKPALTPREKEILKLIAQGYISKQIAELLNVSRNTINNHRKNILDKTGCMNTFEAIKLLNRKFF